MYNYMNIFWKGSFEYGTLVQIIEHRFQSMSQTKSLNLDQEVLVLGSLKIGLLFKD